jgi:hypothetical protein
MKKRRKKESIDYDPSVALFDFSQKRRRNNRFDAKREFDSKSVKQFDWTDYSKKKRRRDQWQDWED